MTNPAKEQPGPNDFEQAIESLVGVFTDINLAEHFRGREQPLRIGLLEAGIPLEAWALDRYLRANGIQRGEMIAYDTDEAGAHFTQITKDLQDFQYVVGDLTNPSTLTGQFDLLVARKADIAAESLQRIFAHAFDHLAQTGRVVVIAEESNARFLRPALQARGVIEKDISVVRPKVPAYFVEGRVLTARKQN